MDWGEGKGGGGGGGRRIEINQQSNLKLGHGHIALFFRMAGVKIFRPVESFQLVVQYAGVMYIEGDLSFWEGRRELKGHGFFFRRKINGRILVENACNGNV